MNPPRRRDLAMKNTDHQTSMQKNDALKPKQTPSRFISRTIVASSLKEVDAKFEKTIKLEIQSIEQLPVDSGVNLKWKLTFANGVSALFKPGTQLGIPYQKWPERSFVAFKIDRLFDLYLIPPTYIIDANVGRGTERGSAMLWLEHAVKPEDLELTNADRPDEMKLLDAVVGNRDRKDSDWLIGSDGAVYAVDNDSTFRHFDSLRGTEKVVWEHEISSIESKSKRKEFHTRICSIQLEEIAPVLKLLDSDEQDRFRRAMPLIIDYLDAR